MKTDIITLTIDTVLPIHNMAMGTLYVYRVLDGSEVEIPVDIDYDYQPFERMTQDYPGCPAEATITRMVDSVTGSIEYDTNEIDNIQQAEDEILVKMAEDAYNTKCEYEERKNG